MTDFTKILNKAKELEAKMKESQEKIKNIKVEGMSGANSVKVTLNGDGEMIQIDISPESGFKIFLGASINTVGRSKVNAYSNEIPDQSEIIHFEL